MYSKEYKCMTLLRQGRVRIRDGLLIEQVICISKIKLLNITPFAIGVMFNPVKCYLI